MKFNLTLLVIVTSFISCSKKNVEPESINNSKSVVSSISIKDAESLLIVEPKNTSKDSSNLYKVTKDGSLESVFYKNIDGSLSNKREGNLLVNKIINLNSDYLVINGQFTFNIAIDNLVSSKNYETLLVRKSDGAIFNYGLFDFDMEAQTWQSEFYRPKVFFDQNDNIYYRSRSSEDGRKSITKISLKNPNNITKEDYLPKGQNLTDGTIDFKGNLAFSINENDSYRIKTPSGSISILTGGIPMDINQTFVNEFWTGINGKLYISGYDKGLPYIGIVKPEENNRVEKVWTGLNCQNYYPNNCRTASKWKYWRFKKDNNIMFVSTRGYNSDIIFEIWKFDEITNSIVYNLTEGKGININNFKNIGKSDNYIFFQNGNNDLYKYSLENSIITKVNNSPLTGLEFYAFNVSENGSIEFTALRFGDGKEIIGKINNNGTLSIISENINGKPIALERIN